MDHDAIRRVSQTLQRTLVAAFDGEHTYSVYVGPLDDLAASEADVILFLYRVAVNADLRNAEHHVPAPQPGDPPIVYEGALPLDLYYLLTVGKRNQGGELDGLGLLGFAMQVLNDSPNLGGADVQGETVRLSLDPVTSEEMSRIWTLFPAANYRTSVVYIASPVWIDPPAPRQPAPPVTHEHYPVEPIRT